MMRWSRQIRRKFHGLSREGVIVIPRISVPSFLSIYGSPPVIVMVMVSSHGTAGCIMKYGDLILMRVEILWGSAPLLSGLKLV